MKKKLQLLSTRNMKRIMYTKNIVKEQLQKTHFALKSGL